MATPELPNPFSALEPERVAENGRCPGLTDPPVAATVNLSLSGDAYEILQHMRTVSSARGIPAEVSRTRRPEEQLQDLHKIFPARKVALGSENQGPCKAAGPGAASHGRGAWKNIEAGSLPSLLGQNTDASFGCTPSRLFKGPGSDLAMPVLPRRRAPDLAAGSRDEPERFVLDEDRFLADIEPLPIFLQTPRDIVDIFARSR